MTCMSKARFPPDRLSWISWQDVQQLACVHTKEYSERDLIKLTAVNDHPKKGEKE